MQLLVVSKFLHTIHAAERIICCLSPDFKGLLRQLSWTSSSPSWSLKLKKWQCQFSVLSHSLVEFKVLDTSISKPLILLQTTTISLSSFLLICGNICCKVPKPPYNTFCQLIGNLPAIVMLFFFFWSLVQETNCVFFFQKFNVNLHYFHNRFCRRVIQILPSVWCS